MRASSTGAACPETRKGRPLAGATLETRNQVSSSNLGETTRTAALPQGRALADMIASCREHAAAHLVAGLSGLGADAHSELALGRHYARRAETLALYAGGLR